MINKILLGIIYLISALVQLILTPIDAAITLALPDLSAAFTSIGSFLTIVFQSMGWCISLLGLSPNVISLIVIYYTFSLTLSFGESSEESLNYFDFIYCLGG